MSRISLLLSSMGQGSAELLRWDLGTKTTKDITLTYQDAVAEMSLRIDHVFALDDQGQEHFVAHFDGQRLLLGSNTRGNSLKLNGTVSLQAGKYNSIRFYLAEGSSQTDTNRVTKKLSEVDFVDFMIKDGLLVETSEMTEFQMNFKMNSFSFRSFWDSYGEMCYSPWMKGRLGAF